MVSVGADIVAAEGSPLIPSSPMAVLFFGSPPSAILSQIFESPRIDHIESPKTNFDFLCEGCGCQNSIHRQAHTVSSAHNTLHTIPDPIALAFIHAYFCSCCSVHRVEFVVVQRDSARVRERESERERERASERERERESVCVFITNDTPSRTQYLLTCRSLEVSGVGLSVTGVGLSVTGVGLSVTGVGLSVNAYASSH